MRKVEFSKILIGMDYLLLVVLLICTIIFKEVDLTAITVGWIAQLGVSTGFYYWKSRLENKVKVPLYVLEEMPDEYKEQMDLTQIVTTILQNE